MRKSKYELLIFWVQVWGDGIHPIFQKLNQIKWLSNELNSQFYWFTQWNYAIHSSHIIQVIQLKTGYSCTLMSWFCCSENSVLSDGKPCSSSIFLKIMHDSVFSWKFQASPSMESLEASNYSGSNGLNLYVLCLLIGFFYLLNMQI